MRIGLLSDTHGWLDPSIVNFFSECKEVWHCGDIGDIGVIDELEKHFTVRAVYGNIDGGELRRVFPESSLFECEGVKVFMTHIGGYPGHYNHKIVDILKKERPGIFLCGHSHILKVMYDKKLNSLHINPGAAGRYGFHNVRTAIRFAIDEGRVNNLEVLELKR